VLIRHDSIRIDDCIIRGLQIGIMVGLEPCLSYKRSSLVAIPIVDLAMSTLICSYISDYRKVGIDWIAMSHALLYWHEITLRVSIVSSHLTCILKQAV